MAPPGCKPRNVPKERSKTKMQKGKQVLAEQMGTAKQVAKCEWGGGAHGCVMEWGLVQATAGNAPGTSGTRCTNLRTGRRSKTNATPNESRTPSLLQSKGRCEYPDRVPPDWRKSVVRYLGYLRYRRYRGPAQNWSSQAYLYPLGSPPRLVAVTNCEGERDG